MKYQCGHSGCDVCGARTCSGLMLKQFEGIVTCEYCIMQALKLAIHVSETFSVQIDLDKPCLLK